MLAKLCAELGIGSEEVIAFGDLPIDLSMLEWAGHSVGPRNAHPYVLSRVDAVCLSNDEDGVAVELDRLLSIGAFAAETKP
ncbi:MAG: HAD family hydrolase [Actinomycetota bacterium]